MTEVGGTLTNAKPFFKHAHDDYFCRDPECQDWVCEPCHDAAGEAQDAHNLEMMYGC